MINHFGKVKLIDMRGKLGSELSILGDPFYDWGKVYQSLVGYDEILHGRLIDSQYKARLLKVFDNWFIDKFSQEDLTNVKMVTALLLFTLIPLHDNDKCHQYCNLADSILAKTLDDLGGSWASDFAPGGSVGAKRSYASQRSFASPVLAASN